MPSVVVGKLSERRGVEGRAGAVAYALCYELADRAAGVAGDAEKRALLGYAADVMELITRRRADWGVVYPEEREA